MTTVTKSDLAQIVAQASYLSERLTKEYLEIPEAPENKKQLIDERLNHWCQIVAQGNWEKFQKRLQWDDIELDKLPSILGTVQLKNNQPLPTWAETLSQIIETASQLATPESETTHQNIPLNPESPLPYQDILLPALIVARQKLLTRLGAISQLSENAYLEYEKNFFQDIINLCASTLNLEFSQTRSVGHSLLLRLIGETQNKDKKEKYNGFVQKLLQDGLLAFFQKYPVLARAIATRIELWVTATAEFLQRLQTDIPQIKQTFNPNNPHQLGKVTQINPSVFDTRQQGHFVITLTFESGLKLVYKPRNLGLAIAYNQLLEWSNQQGEILPLKVVTIINRENYGWMEYVQQQPCQNQAQAQQFYQRVGILICLLYILGGTDFHGGNLIANGEHPVVIDLETLLHPEANLMEQPPELLATKMSVNQQLWDSVLQTGMLPRWQFSKDHRVAYDVSGLGTVDPQQIFWRVQRWQSINTDDMHITQENLPMPVNKNVPMLNGEALSPTEYLEELIAGFEQMYRFAIAHRQQLLATDSPLQSLQAKKVRFAFRTTHVYRIILQQSLDPKFLKHGIDRSIELDLLTRAFLTTTQKPNAWPILHAEFEAMEQLDIPHFEAFSDSDTLTVGLKQPIDKYFKEPSYNQLIRRLQQLDETDLSRQIAIIRGAFHAKIAQINIAARKPETEQETVDISQITPLSSGQLLQAATRIAEEIEQRAMVAADGSVNWMGLAYVPGAERFQLQILGTNLYDGNCGIALFLAALDYVSGTNQFRDLALGSLQFLRQYLQVLDTEFVRTRNQEIEIGGASGLGSLIYALVKVSQFLQETALLEDALRVARMMTPETIAADRHFDVMSGAAGGILGLLALAPATEDAEVLQKAIACGQHLLHYSFDGMGEKPIAGFAQGGAGIAYSLFRLYAVTQDQVYLDAACQQMAQESPLLSKVAELNGSWSNGIAGIGLARLGSMSIYQKKEIRLDAETAIEITQKLGWQEVDNLCYGNMGFSELLLVAARFSFLHNISHSQLLQTAQQIAAGVIAKAEANQGYKLFANLPNSVFSPSLFQGSAGIGYGFIRLAFPEILPSVLLWE